MKKILLTLLGAVALTAGAQVYQVPNSDFESWTSDYEPGGGWYSFVSAQGTYSGFKSKSQENTTQLTGTSAHGGSGKSACLKSRTIMVVSKANGNLTTGCVNMGSTSATESGDKNYNFTDRDGSNCCLFVGRPDSVEYYYTFSSGGSTTPRLHAILHGDTDYKDPKPSNEATYKIAEATVYASTNSSWTRAVGAFSYTGVESTTAYMLASFTTNENPGVTSGDVFCVDDVRFIYNSKLSALSINGTAVSGFDKDTYAYTSTETYTEGTTTVTATADGHGATVEQSYDESTALLTITVKGNDISNDATNYHTYTIQFAKATVPAATLTSATVGGVTVTEFTKVSDTEYKAELPIVYNQGLVAEGTPADGGTMVKNTDYDAYGITEYGFYDNTAKTITLKVANTADEETSYVFSFTEPVTTSEILGNYAGALSVVLGANGENIIAPLSNATITLTQNQNGTYNIALPNFSFAMMDMLVGDIYVPGLTLSVNKLSATAVSIRLASDDTEAIGIMLGHLPVTIDLTLDDTTCKYADASIDIITTESEVEMVKMFSTIHVDYVPFQVDEDATKVSEGDNSAYTNQKLTGYVSKASTAFLHLNEQTVGTPMDYIDMTDAWVASDVTAADLKQGALDANNTVYYLPEDASYAAGTNVSVGGTAQAFELNDAVGINIPTAFTAEKFSYDRELTAGNLTTFVLPFTTDASNINGTVYKLTGLTTDAFNFEAVSKVEANTPYVVEATGTALFTDDNAGGTVAAANAETAPKLELTGITHMGNYGEAETLTSDASTAYYGYASGEFKKAATGTLNRYRTAFAVSGSAAAPAYRFGTGTTGITTARADAAAATAYDLQGRRVSTVGKGVYVVNGKKVIK